MELNSLEEASIEDLLSARKGLTDLLDSYGFTIYRGMIEHATVSRLNSLLAPATSIEGILKQQHQNGFYQGLMSAIRMIPGKIEEINSIIQAKQEAADATRPSSPQSPAPEPTGSTPESNLTDVWASVTDNPPGQAVEFAGLQEPEPPVAEPTPSAPAQTQPVQEPPVATQPVQPPQPPQAVPAEPTEPLDPAWQERGLAALAQGYTFTDEQRQQFEDDPAGALPSLAARLHMNVMLQVGTMIQHYFDRALPQAIQSRIEASAQRSRVETVMESRVYSQYPELRNVPPDVAKTLANVLRQRFPKASFEEGVREYAKAAYAMYGWPLPGGNTPPQPAPPAAPPAAAPPVPYAPAMPGGMTPPPAPNGAAGGNPFADLLDPH